MDRRTDLECSLKLKYIAHPRLLAQQLQTHTHLQGEDVEWRRQAFAVTIPGTFQVSQGLLRYPVVPSLEISTVIPSLEISSCPIP